MADNWLDELRQLAAHSPIESHWWQRPVLALDLSAENPRLQGFDPAQPDEFSDWISAECARAGAEWAHGGYGEVRVVYRMSPLFGGVGEGARTVHLGVDLWLPAGSPVFAVLPGTVHSIANNARFGDYGPTVILEHRVLGRCVHTLYGHLASRTLSHLNVGQAVAGGEQIAWLGTPEENLGWPPHLHFQIITEIADHQGDYPGVCSPAERAQWLARCPDPARLIPGLRP